MCSLDLEGRRINIIRLKKKYRKTCFLSRKKKKGGKEGKEKRREEVRKKEKEGKGGKEGKEKEGRTNWKIGLLSLIRF